MMTEELEPCPVCNSIPCMPFADIVYCSQCWALNNGGNMAVSPSIEKWNRMVESKGVNYD